MNLKTRRKPTFSSEPRLHLGDRVSHDRFGAGQVLSLLPGGNVLVRFKGAAKARQVWPAYLERMNGRQQ
jgi:hypothetical protein